MIPRFLGRTPRIGFGPIGRRASVLGTWFLASALVSVVPAHADDAMPLRTATEALAAGDYERAYAEFLFHAESDANALAQFNLALFHENGWGRPADPVEACRWHEKAAKGAIPFSSHRFAECLASGTAGAPDSAGAARWFRTAVELGHYTSLCDLAELYIRGEGVPKDPHEGIALCTQAAERGSPRAQLRLAIFYLEGDDAVRDRHRGALWLEASASQGLAEAQYRLGDLLLHHAGDDPTAVPAARRWLETAAGAGYPPAYVPVGELYLSRASATSDDHEAEHALAKAYLWLSAAVRRGSEVEAHSKAEALLARVREVMPASWAPALDAKVDAHLAEQVSKP